MKSKSELVQVQNPKTGKYIRINKTTGMITGHKRTDGPYVNIPVRKRKPAGTWQKGKVYGEPKPSVPHMAPEKKMRTIKEPVKKPESFTSAQAREAVKKVSARKAGLKKAVAKIVRKASRKRVKEKVFVVLKDIVIKRGTALRLAADEVTRVEPHYEHFVGFVAAPDACGEFCIAECDMEAAPEYFVELKD